MAQQYIGTGRLEGPTTSVAASGTSAQTTTFGSQTYKVRVAANTAVHGLVGSATTVTASVADAFIPANAPEYFTVTPGQRIAFVTAATNGLVTSTAGTVWVTEVK